MAYFTSRRDKDLFTQIVDYSGDYPNRVANSLGEASYGELKTGTIRVNGKEVRTFPISSYPRAKEIADLLKAVDKGGKLPPDERRRAPAGTRGGHRMSFLEEREPRQ